MGDVKYIKGGSSSRPPNEALIEAIKKLLLDVETGTIVSFIGIGIQEGGQTVMNIWGNESEYLYTMTGAIGWTWEELIHRNPQVFGE
jgi:hypothetical protein